jgi:hypothetical protein
MTSFLIHAFGAGLGICAFLDGLHQYDKRGKDTDIPFVVVGVGAFAIALLLL